MYVDGGKNGVEGGGESIGKGIAKRMRKYSVYRENKSNTSRYNKI